MVGVPGPEAFARVTVLPDTGLPLASLQGHGDRGGGRAVRGHRVGEATTVERRPTRAPAVPVAVKVTGEPVSEPLVAVMVFEPAVVPRVQLPTVAMPEALVVAEPPVSEPPPVPISR